MSEWLKVMLEEIARKKAEAEDARIEEQKRRDATPHLAEPKPSPRSGTDRAQG
jgi:hypothetical protein